MAAKSKTKPAKAKKRDKSATASGRASEATWHGWLWHQLRVQIRLIASIILGVLVAAFVPLDEPIDRILAGWNAGGALYIALLLTMMLGAEIDGIKRQAELEEESRLAALIITTLGAIAMFLAIVAQLSALGEERGSDRSITFALAFSTIIVSWFLVQIVFAVYYAHEFHSESGKKASASGGGLKFPGEETPDYLDFLYFSLVVGTTNQTSDTDVTSRPMRRVTMIHGLLSFFFNTMVIALTVNLTAQLVQGG
jgi:uncharacterized membrane protein